MQQTNDTVSFKCQNERECGVRGERGAPAAVLEGVVREGLHEGERSCHLAQHRCKGPWAGGDSVVTGEEVWRQPAQVTAATGGRDEEGEGERLNEGERLRCLLKLIRPFQKTCCCCE